MYKDYVIAQAGNIIGMALCSCEAGDKSFEDKNIEMINQYLKEYDSGIYYENDNVRRKSYELFVEKNMPQTLKIVKSALKSELVDKVKWAPVIKSFIDSANKYLEDGKVLVKD